LSEEEFLYDKFIDPERKILRDNRIIQLNGDIEDGISYSFIQDMEILLLDTSLEPIRIIISSAGGNVFAGLSIITSIQKAQKKGIKIIGDVHGHACSMGFLILQTCDERKMSKLSTLMAHGVTTGLVGDQRSVESETKLLNTWRDKLSKLISDRCSKKNTKYCTADYWSDIFRSNVPQWYSAEECVEMGLIDVVE
jgi:ATP-dependent protease ClpP protease subunit